MINNISSQRHNEAILPNPIPTHDIARAPAAKGKHEVYYPEINQRTENKFQTIPLAPEFIPPGQDVWPQNEAAQALCFIFRDELSIYFPFVTPPNEPAPILQRNHPCLFKAMVLAASYQNRSLQVRRGAALTEELAKRLLIDGEKSRDILQALLISIAW